MYQVEEFSGDLEKIYPLLLEADEEGAVIEKYIHDCRIFVIKINEEVASEVCVKKFSDTHFELMNVATDGNFRQIGLAKTIISFVIEKIKRERATHNEILVEVKTWDLSVEAVSLYESCGFIKQRVVKNYFLHAYSQPIFENGQQLLNQVILAQKI